MRRGHWRLENESLGTAFFQGKGAQSWVSISVFYDTNKNISNFHMFPDECANVSFVSDMHRCCLSGDLSRMDLPLGLLVEPYPAWLKSISRPRALEGRWASGEQPLVDWGLSLASHVTIPSPLGHYVLRSLPRPCVDHVWLNSEACFIFRISRTTGFLPADHLLGLSLAKDVSGEPHPHYKMWLKYFIESSALGPTNSFQQMSGDALNKSCYMKINCNVLCFCYYLCVFSFYH